MPLIVVPVAEKLVVYLEIHQLVLEQKTSSSTQQTPNDKSLSQQTLDDELSIEQNLDEPPVSPLQETTKTQTKPTVLWIPEKKRTKKTFQKPPFQKQEPKKNHVALCLSVHFIINKFYF